MILNQGLINLKDTVLRRFFSELTLIGIGLLLLISCTEESEAWRDPRNMNGDQAPGEFLHGEFIDNFTYKVYPKNDENFDLATFKLWLPDTSEDLMGILVLLPIHNGSAMSLYEDKNWREFATAHHLALVSVMLYTSRETVGYINAANGSGRALNEAISKLGEENGLADFESLKYVFRGYEVGASFCISFSENYPKKVAAIGSIRGTSGGNEINNNLNIPTLMVIGDLDFRMPNNRSAVLSKREVGGLWALAIEPGKDRLGSQLPSDNLIRSFLTFAIENRIDPDTKLLKSIPEEYGWLGDNNTFDIKPFGDYQDNVTEASWLIHGDFASDWRQFQLK